MNYLASESLSSKPMQLAQEFISGFAHNRDVAIENLKNSLVVLEAGQFHECIDQLGALLIKTDSSDDAWQAVFDVLRGL